MTKEVLIQEWFEYAIRDYELANHVFKTMYRKPLEIICYHCQQATEKALKGFLVYCDIVPPRIHDLEALLDICLSHDSRFEIFNIDIANVLTNYSVETRYPSLNKMDITESDARIALLYAKQALETVANLIPFVELSYVENHLQEQSRLTLPNPDTLDLLPSQRNPDSPCFASESEKPKDRGL